MSFQEGEVTNRSPQTRINPRSRRTPPRWNEVFKGRSGGGMFHWSFISFFFVSGTLLALGLIFSNIYHRNLSGMLFSFLFFLIGAFITFFFLRRMISTYRVKTLIINPESVSYKDGQGSVIIKRWQEIASIGARPCFGSDVPTSISVRGKYGRNIHITDEDMRYDDIKNAFLYMRDYALYHNIEIDNKTTW